MRAWKIVLLALSGLRRTPLRGALTALGVAIASAALVSMMAFALGLQQQIEAPMQLLSLLNDIRVSPKEGEQAQKAPPLDDAAVQRLGQLPGVITAFPNIRVRGIKISHGTKTAASLAVAIPREARLLGVTDEVIVAGRFVGEGHNPEAVLGGELLHSLGFASPREAVGATVMIEASGLTPGAGQSFTLEHKKLAVTVVGVYELPLIVPPLARSGVLLPVDVVKQIPGSRLESALNQLQAGGSLAWTTYANVTVRVRNMVDLAGVEKQIQQMGYQTSTILSHFQQMQTFFLFLQILLAAIGTVALVVAGLGIVNTLLMAVLERYQEIGICKAIGASDGDLTILFLTEAGLLGLAGGLGGLALGRAVSYVLEMAINAYAHHHGVVDRLQVFAFPFWLLAATVIFAALISLLAGVYPALRAARVDPIRALRRG